MDTDEKDMFRVSRKLLSIILSVSLVLSSIENVVACVCLEETSANDSKTYAQCDSLSRVTSLRLYDNAGNLVRTVDANGTVSVMGYDMLGRKITEHISGSGATINRGYTFERPI